MKRMISIVGPEDWGSSRIFVPVTLPPSMFPLDLDRDRGVASLLRSYAHYSRRTGKSVTKASLPKPLSWRAHGEECLVANLSEAMTERWQLHPVCC